MMMNGKIILFFHMFDDFLQPRISEFLHFPTHFAYNMFVFPVIVCSFELSYIIPELMFVTSLHSNNKSIVLYNVARLTL